MTQRPTPQTSQDIEKTVDRFRAFLSTSNAPTGLLAPDITMHVHDQETRARLEGAKAIEEAVRAESPSWNVQVHDHAATQDGFVVELTKQSESGDVFDDLAWCRLQEGLIKEIRYYCTRQ